MEALTNWLGRLQGASPDSLRACVTPTLVAGLQGIEIANSIVALEPKGLIPSRLGDCAPLFMSFLHYCDIADCVNNLQTQEDLRADLGSLLTFVADRRILLPNVFGMSLPGQRSVTFMGYGAAVDGRLGGPFPSGIESSFRDSLSRVVGLPENLRLIIGTALRLHHASVELFEYDLRAAYLLLVAGLEVLSREFGEPPGNWNDWEEATTWENVFSIAELTNDQSELLRSHLMSNRQLRLRATFREYASCRIPDSFWSESWEHWVYGYNHPSGEWLPPHLSFTKTVEEILPHDRRLLSRMLGRTYDVRSGIVHRGALLKFADNALPTRIGADPDSPLPYPVLRSILRYLIKEELETHAKYTTLPDIKFIPKTAQDAT